MPVNKLMLSALCAGASLLAQSHVTIHPTGVAIPPNEATRFFSVEFSYERDTVKAAPYSAQAVTETTQMLPDGNRIHRTSTAMLARDSEGRTRREQNVKEMGLWTGGEGPSPLVIINDPVAQVNYTLETRSKSAVKRSASPEQSAKQMAEMKAKMEGIAVSHVREQSSTAEVNEQLGSKMIEGVQAEGRRSTRTIPAGTIGNDRPLVYVNEVWTSPDLKVIVMSRRTDPMAGEIVYTLTNIQRSEPDPELFRPPADYTLREEKNFVFERRAK